MRRWRTAGMLVATLVALSTFSACGSPTSGGSTSGAPGPDTSTSFTDLGNSGGAASGGRAETRHPDRTLVDPHPSAWERARGRGRRVTLFYWSGVAECYGLHHVAIDETDRKVTVTLYEGRRPEAEACIEIAVQVKTTVTLQRPLGTRTLVDGAE